MAFRLTERIRALPPYLFIELDKLKNEAVARGVDVINLGIGDPDHPTPRLIIDALAAAAAVTENHRYPLGAGQIEFRREVARYYERVHGVGLDPATEIIALIGSKEGIGHFPLAFVDPGDVVLVPDPGYPVYRAATLFAGGELYAMPLLKGNGYLPDLDAIPDAVFARVKLMFLNYPNNPTAAMATRDFFEQAIFKARKHGFIILHDAAYLDITYGGVKALSFLEIPGAREVGIELHSLSKTFNMTGWRIGFAAGNSELVQGLLTVKTNLDSGVFNAIQYAGVAAMRHYDQLLPGIVKVYESRQRTLMTGLRELGWPSFEAPHATFYVWAPTRGGRSSMETTRNLIDMCGIVATPGIGLGAAGEGFVRFALTTDEKRIELACRRMKQAGV
ncbi:MAG: LL-diaminopimelate aminotransferase [bacterium]|nr:LL-diaminopimelate aminotransferase [Candidatus Sumerlaeota bacterium]